MLSNVSNSAVSGVQTQTTHEQEPIPVVSVRNVSFSFDVQVHIFQETDNSHRKLGGSLSLIEKEFRRDVDKEARKHGLTWAENHTDWRKHYPFSLDRVKGNEG
ncbi:hypothetical protein VII00023_14126 [Vibrio ichthyoenteri ATCC 700023]|uniref:Uncharacterized protein n=1 Tax=Vibrio ichthyoenteri ATCC 700023 TaxID=870968 RepID=F9S040_9VIBR|nr:hypothetical protein VII00023_14126 [Vibrio ichthyoenteri ATCC 700023]